MTADADDEAVEIELELLDDLEANAEQGFHPVILVFTGDHGSRRVFSPLEGAELHNLLRGLADVAARDGDGTDVLLACGPVAIPELGEDAIIELRELCEQMRAVGCTILLAAFIDSAGNVRTTSHRRLTEPGAPLAELADDMLVDAPPSET